MTDCAVIADRPLLVEEVEQLALELSYVGDYKGTRTIGPGCIHCLGLPDTPMNDFGVFLPATRELFDACDGLVIVYGLCRKCRKPDVLVIRENIFGAMRRMASLAAHGKVKVCA